MIDDLARRERVPARIAKGELDGKMKCRIWKKLHGEEARRFDKAYTLMEKHQELSLADAFGVVQSGLPVDQFMQRRARVKKKEEVKKARGEVAGDAVDALLNGWLAANTELMVVLAERTALDNLKSVERVSFVFEKMGQTEKLQVVALTKQALWEAKGNSFERDPKLTQTPAPVTRQPARRPYSDPRPFLEWVGKTITITLRNGLILDLPLLGVGPFDLLLGTKENEIFVPLHAVAKWLQGLAVGAPS
ncbi:MAG: hypothetical protein K1X64_04210 [Myxococcaceae bacterium]|nr:hypothetical protein [Myxococcaceae bacterium]